MARKSLPWLRLYTEFSTDYKVQMMPESMQRRLIMLFCFQREGTLNSMTDDEIAYRLGISKSKWKMTRQRFFENGFVNNNEKIKIGDDFLVNFSTRQKDSDDSTKRKQNQRLREVSHNYVTGQTCDMSQKCLNIDIDTYTQEKELKKRNKKKKILSGKPDLSPPPPDVHEIFEFWKETMGSQKSKIDEKRKKSILAAMKIGYSVRDICDAISGCAKDSFSMGQNDRNKKFNDINLICRDAEHIDKFIEINNSTESSSIEYDGF